jgi:uncharacterized protein
MKSPPIKNDASTLPAGTFSSWLHDIRSALQEDSSIRVPCGTCRACCHSSYFIHIKPDERNTLKRIPNNLRFPAPLRPDGHLVMGYDQDGRCPMLSGNRCSIYTDRPITCRVFDSRVLAASGLVHHSSENNAVFHQARRWQFHCPSKRDRQLLSAVRAAAIFLKMHPDCIPGGLACCDDIQVAVSAIKVYDVFFKINRSVPTWKLSDTEITQKISKLYKKFDRRSEGDKKIYSGNQTKGYINE